MGAAPSPARLLAAWEHARGLPPVDRGRALLRVASASATDAEVASMSVGDADRRLVGLRAAMFGDRFEAVCQCPRCQASIALEFQTADFVASRAAGSAAPLRVQSGAYEIEVRLPTVDDLATAAEARSVTGARHALMQRCITSVRRANGDEVADVRALPSEVVADIGAALERADPLVSTRIAVQCPVCEHAWSTALDIAGYLWSELESWAAQLLREVHVIAGAYGWSETEILSLSARRRRTYIEMIVA